MPRVVPRSPKLDPAAGFAAKLIEQIEVEALDLHVDTRTLGVAVARHLTTWFEALPNALQPRKIRRAAASVARRRML